MARRKTITREHILNAAHEVVSTEGFSGFTARNIASKMKSSTQPIYLEFKNMDELREAFFEEVETYLRDDIFSKSISGDPIIDLTLNYVDFAKKEKMLFRALFVEDHADGKLLNEFGFQMFLAKAKGIEEYEGMSDEAIHTAFLANWITATGLASLATSERMNATNEEMIQIVKLVNKSLKRNPDFTITM
ncbi:TetR/AcrR family transcriptional regulator [Vagococcus sp. DIV0080]|uniref:TetR/AcrR family transcriptional regulator n=1 Tax=Candidatus Vagococcus giribetii TaxID=2230876 RepID=A0ABS3HX91_9ENTE|nr:TetR family transcriptional regulator [Vagococcus sp. DIV0080]MBO0477426.1 TetR/AcrR family transcriptional regulator [Vagococcus sp. DIV0080]